MVKHYVLLCIFQGAFFISKESKFKLNISKINDIDKKTI